MKQVTVLFLRREGEILLAMKKRGFGEGKWNGAGGKVEPGERIQAAAIRECQEEIGVTPLDPQLVGKIEFRERSDPSFGHFAHIYVATKWKGEPTETDEMRPQWFKLGDIPYHSMWADDPLWLPLVLSGKRFNANFTLDGNKLVAHDITETDSITEDEP